VSEPPRDRFLPTAALYAALVALVFVLQLFPQLGARGVLSSPELMSRELGATERDPWPLTASDARHPAFRGAVVLTYRALGGGAEERELFHGVFVTVSALSLLAAAWAFDLLLVTLGFTGRQAMLGVALLLLGFPVVFAHDVPLHTREDPLAWAWLALTLTCLARERLRAVAVLSILGAVVQERALFVLLAAALAAHGRRALPVVAVGLGALAIARQLFFAGTSAAPPTPSPWGEAALFAFATFGALWPAAGARLIDPAPPRHPLLSRRVVGAVALMIILFWTTFPAREARVAYALFPFVIPLALDARLHRSRVAWTASLVTLALGVAGLALVLARPDDVIPPLRRVIGDWFNPGAQQTPFDFGDVTMEEPVFASRLQGPFVIAHLAASMFIITAARRR
jgi:hypothetical protein